MGGQQHRLSGANPWKGGDMHGPNQSIRHQNLAQTNKSQRCPIFSGILQLLPTLHTRIFKNHETPQQTHVQRCPLLVGRQTRTCVQWLTRPGNQWTSAKTPPTRQTIQSRSGCLWIRLRRHTTTKTRRWQKTSHRVLFCHPEWRPAKVWHLWARAPSHRWVSKTLETLPSWLTTQNHSAHRSHQPHILVPTAENQQTHHQTSAQTRRVQH